MSGDPPRVSLEPGFDRAVELVRKCPIRWSTGDSGRGAVTVLDNGWFDGADECARILASVAPAETVKGGGFGGAWPLLVGCGLVLAPAMPVASGARGEAAVDGAYRRTGETIWREAVGVDEPFLVTRVSGSVPGAPFELLWFGAGERYTLRAGLLEIEDLFGVMSVPATPDLLERELVRGRRVDPGLLSCVRMPKREDPQTIEVCRPAVLSGDQTWRDPEAFLATRADVERAHHRGGSIEILGADGSSSTFESKELETGWMLTLENGRYPLTTILLERRETMLRFRATLDGRVNGLAPGMRGRLIFDLRSDLVALG